MVFLWFSGGFLFIPIEINGSRKSVVNRTFFLVNDIWHLRSVSCFIANIKNLCQSLEVYLLIVQQENIYTIKISLLSLDKRYIYTKLHAINILEITFAIRFLEKAPTSRETIFQKTGIWSLAVILPGALCSHFLGLGPFVIHLSTLFLSLRMYWSEKKERWKDRKESNTKSYRIHWKFSVVITEEYAKAKHSQHFSSLFKTLSTSDSFIFMKLFFFFFFQFHCL